MPQAQHERWRRLPCRRPPVLILACALGSLWWLAAEAVYAASTGQCTRLPDCTPGAAVVPTTVCAPLNSLEPIDAPWPDGISPEAAELDPGWREALALQAPLPTDNDHSFDFHALGRGYYVNDQRIEWSGVEATLGAEGQFAPAFRQECQGWDLALLGDFYLNQPFDRNQLADTPERRSYHANWEVETFQISNLLLSAQHDQWLFVLGKMETPFGRYYTPLYSNLRFDAPFIRTEVINWRETGLLIRHSGDLVVLDAAVTNGNEDGDTNSSKGLVSRVGMQRTNWAAGASIKWQDGNGSESQKAYDNQVGADLMFRYGRLIVSSEIVWDQYGLRRPGLDPNDITWGRSIYFRDINKTFHKPANGFGYYVDVAYQWERCFTSFNYGAYYPDQLGVPQQDVINRRGILKVAYDIFPHWQFYLALILETSGYVAQDNRLREGNTTLGGFQARY